MAVTRLKKSLAPVAFLFTFASLTAADADLLQPRKPGLPSLPTISFPPGFPFNLPSPTKKSIPYDAIPRPSSTSSPSSCTDSETSTPGLVYTAPGSGSSKPPLTVLVPTQPFPSVPVPSSLNSIILISTGGLGLPLSSFAVPSIALPASTSVFPSPVSCEGRYQAGMFKTIVTHVSYVLVSYYSTVLSEETLFAGVCSASTSSSGSAPVSVPITFSPSSKLASSDTLSSDFIPSSIFVSQSPSSSRFPTASSALGPSSLVAVPGTSSTSGPNQACGTTTGAYTITYSELLPQPTGEVEPDFRKVVVYGVHFPVDDAAADDRPSAEDQCQHFCDGEPRCVASWYVGYLFGTTLAITDFTTRFSTATIVSGAAFNGKCTSATLSTAQIAPTTFATSSQRLPISSSGSSLFPAQTSGLSSFSEILPTCTRAPQATTDTYTLTSFAEVKPTGTGTNFLVNAQIVNKNLVSYLTIDRPAADRPAAENDCSNFCIATPGCLSLFLGFGPYVRSNDKWTCYALRVLIAPDSWLDSPKAQLSLAAGFARICPTSSSLVVPMPSSGLGGSSSI
ncbi:hypothetical protein MBM_01519 [Drepanopeziza brunnea f. sp. 'multigermtubi' MB_m1]|uniref:Apple domain-containing protein n=1 Tax=Marssonina brunnea f. sp. multigermtubi (strain MB_m1) TaxID=1072389 RepID=K1X6W1_MARBU|nr:uncharacterized protein MBM_01519 [Drepanopeziza brunnea f. sp. 'multigermtubi' MB_m1]EKD20837.1 hypothetical protein MBM_01519 [Drepanopeziza brunnea f. sp. 'multigermtubi' MB_m1]